MWIKRHSKKVNRNIVCAVNVIFCFRQVECTFIHLFSNVLLQTNTINIIELKIKQKIKAVQKSKWAWNDKINKSPQDNT